MMVTNGIILVNKERGISSNKVVNKVKYLLKADKAGHLGTLDVLGEGLLPVTLGKGTKLFDYFLNKDKVYKTVFKFGLTTTTLDLEGEVTNQNDVEVNLEDINSILPQFIGKHAQLPPVYSAKKIRGKKAYQLARAGVEEIELKPKAIEIYSVKLLRQIEHNTFEFKLHCSSGTYVRSLCRDMADKLSTYGVMLSIQRTRCGDFDIKNSYTLEDIEKSNYKIIPLDSVFDFPSINLKSEESEKLLNGVNIHFSKDGIFKAYDDNLNFLGVVKVNNNKMSFNLRLI